MNPLVESDDEDDDIFKPERSFFGVFNTLANQWYLKEDKNLFSFHAFPEIPEMLETQAHKKFNFQKYRETKMSQIMVFWSNQEIKMPRNVVFRMNREMPHKFLALKHDGTFRGYILIES